MSKVIVNFAALPFSEKAYQPQFANIGIEETGIEPNINQCIWIDMGETDGTPSIHNPYKKAKQIWVELNNRLQQQGYSSSIDADMNKLYKEINTVMIKMRKPSGKPAFPCCYHDYNKSGLKIIFRKDTHDVMKSAASNLMKLQQDYLRIQSLYELATVKEQDSIEVKNFAQSIMQLANETTLCPPDYSWQLLLPDSINNKLTSSQDYEQIKADLEERNIIIKSFPSQDSTCLLVYGNGIIRKHSPVKWDTDNTDHNYFSLDRCAADDEVIYFLPDQYAVNKNHQASSVVLAFDLTFSDMPNYAPVKATS